MRGHQGCAALLFAFLKKRGGYLFIACVLFVFLQSGFYAGRQSQPFPWSSSTVVPMPPARDPSETHRITKLMEDAESRYREKLKRQSKTLAEAVKEYQRRYGRDPPRGFDAWWTFAQDNGVVMIDDYDVIMEDLEPFWELEGAEVRRRALQAGELSSITLVRVKDGEYSIVNLHPEFKDVEVGSRAKGFSDMLVKFVHTLPDMDFPINSKAEGRILVPWEHRAYPNLTIQDSSVGIETMLGGSFRADWGEEGNVWDAWRRTCPPNSPARRDLSAFRNYTAPYFSTSSSILRAYAIPEPTFALNTAASTLDFCQEPHARYTQGHFFSDWRTIPVLYPIFSPAKARGFADIRIPSHYYYLKSPRYTYGWDPVNREMHERDKMEVDWEEKESSVFWRGATTGGGSHPPGWAPWFQRHRFVRLTSNNVSTALIPVTFLSSNSTSYKTLPVSLSSLNADIMDTAFVTFVGLPESYPGGPEALKAMHRFGDSVPLGTHWQYKYLVDVDGMGYSGRFFAFLESGSVPLKASVYEEYWRDWIEPWLHFIPLSPSYDEIYNIFAYFSGPTKSMLEALEDSNPSSNSATLSDGDKARRSYPPPFTPQQQQQEYLQDTLSDRRLRRIATAGQQWKRTVGRKIDMEAYVYRLALEWARLCSDDRPAMGFKQ